MTRRSPIHILELAATLAAAASGGCGGRGSAASSDAGPRFERDWSANPAVVTLTGAWEIDALGDTHGDPDATFHLLASAGLITTTSPITWSGGAKILVVTGDVIDKGASALPIIDLLMALAPEARAVGGRVIVTLGNHEAEFLGDPTGSETKVFQAELRASGIDATAVAAGAASSPYGAWLRNLPVAALIDDWFFCHAGDSNGDSAAAIGRKFRTAVEGPAGYGDDYLVGMGSLLEANAWWQSSLADSLADASASAASGVGRVDENLGALPAAHIAFGHDPGALDFPGDPLGARVKGELVARYDGRLFPIDVGMSYAVGYSDGALLRISRGAGSAPTSTTVVRRDGTTTSLWP
jgi:diadenosine tetraphosphatase ApaH/serine/threonine PP2A family protein phosphatase